MPLVRSRFRLSYLGIVLAVAVATGIAGLLAGLDSSDSQAALDARDPTVSLAAPGARTEPTPVVRAESARFTPQIPSELLIPPQSLAPPPVARPVAALPTPAVQPEATGSIPRAAAVPLPHKRATQEPKLGRAKSEPRTESASAEITRIKATLKLTPSQERYWPPVEAALRDILTQVGYDSGQPRGGKPRTQAAPAQIDPARVQRLTSAAMPLIMTFDEAQKQEVRRLARIMGLENVASAI